LYSNPAEVCDCNVILKTVWNYSTILPTSGWSGVQSQDNFFERRIAMILKHTPSNILRAAFGFLLVTLLASVGLTQNP
jgi:hypothetical protein